MHFIHPINEAQLVRITINKSVGFYECLIDAKLEKKYSRTTPQPFDAAAQFK